MRPQIHSFAEGDVDEDVECQEVGLLHMLFQEIHEEGGGPRAHGGRIRGPEIVLDCFNDDRQCMNACRMPSDCLRLLMQRIVGVYGHQANGYRIPIQEQVIVTLSYLAHAGTMSGTGTFFGYSTSGAAKVVDRMLKPLGRLFREELMEVDQNYLHPNLTTTPARRAFQGCIGAIDGTHINVYPQGNESLHWRGRSGKTTTNCLGICDHDMIFNYFFVGCPGSFHDARVLNEAESRPQNRFPSPLPGRFYLGDSGYANRIGFLTPYRRTRYHRSQFEGHRPSNRKEMFNRQHSSIRSVIERAFGIWKNKWHIVHYSGGLQGFPIRKQLEIINVTIGLHNFVRRYMLRNQMDDADIGRRRGNSSTEEEDALTRDEMNELISQEDVRMDAVRDRMAEVIHSNQN